ncbi:hypothetical protein V8E52_004466 [Russula decolorans]
MLALACSGPLAGVVKTVDAAKARKESALLLDVTILVVVDPLVVSSDRTDCIRIDGDGDDNEVELRMRELVLLGSGDNTACPLADLARASQSQPPQSQLPQTTMTKSRPKTGPDRPQAYVYAPQRAAAASC